MEKSADRDLTGNPMSPSDIQSPSAYRLLVRIGGVVAASIGCTALLGWVLGFPRLASLGHGLIPMAPSTAILFVAYGIALLLARRTTRDRRAMLLFLFIFAAGAFVSIPLFFLSSLGVYLDIEHFGIKAMGAVDGTPIGHMSPITAFSFLLISLSFLAAITSRPDRDWQAKTAWWIAISLLAGYTMLGLAYLFGTPMFYGGTFIPPAVTTSLAFFALGVALFGLSQPLAWSETGRRDQGERYSFRVLAVVFLFLVAGIISAGYFYQRNHQQHFLAEVERQLSAIADLKLGELMLWREERLGNAGFFHKNTAFASLIRTYFQHPEAKQARRGIEAWVGRIKENRNYNRIFLLDAQGNSRLSLPEATAEPLSRYVRQRAIESLHSGRITFADFYRSEFTGRIYLSILVPIFDPAHEGDALGVLVMRVDPEKYLYPFIQRWPNASTTAETLLVRREGNEVVFLNELRFKKNSALSLRIPLDRKETPSVMAVLGREGVVRGIDYRGKPVLAALRSIPDSPWYLVSRIDVDEVYAPLRERQWITVLLVSAMLVSAGTGVGLVWRQQSSRFYRDKYETELARIELEERLVKVAANVPGVIFQLQLRPDGSSFLPYASSGLEAAYGLRPEDVAQDASPLFAVVHPADAARVTETIRASARSLSAWRNEHRVVHPHKGEIWLEGNATPELKPDGSVLLHGFITDITERKQAENRIKRQVAVMEGINRIFQEALNSRTDENLGESCLAVAEDVTGSKFGFIGEIGPDGFLHDLAISNPGWDACQMADTTGHRRPPGDFEVHGIYGRVLKDGIGFFTNDPVSHPDRIGLPQGHPPLRAFLGVPLIREGLTYGMIAVGNREGGYSRNELESLEALAPMIVEAFLRRRAELALQESERRLRRAEEVAHLGHWSFDLRTNRLYWSVELYQIWGITREEGTAGPTLDELAAFVHPDDLEYQNSLFETIRREGKANFEYRIIRPDGALLNLTGYGELVRDETGAAVTMFGTIQDMTEIKQKERELQEKNAELERFTYMISHDLKSPVVTVKTFLGYLEQDLARSDAVRVEKDMFYMHTAADKMGQLLDELLEMSRVGRVVNVTVHVTFRELVEEALSMVAGRIAEQGVAVLVDDEAVTLYGDRHRMVEIWQNLLENAVKFMGDQQSPRIEIGAQSNGRETVFFVRDNGIGIEMQHREKIFGLFEKLDPKSDGTGLGLALVKRIVELYQGKIWLESEGVGQGACFRFTLPAAVQGNVKGERS